MKSVKIILSVLVVFYFYTSAFSQSPQPGDTTLFNKAKDSTILYLDWSKMTTSVKAEFIKIISHVDVKNNFVKMVKIVPNDNISRVAKLTMIGSIFQLSLLAGK